MQFYKSKLYINGKSNNIGTYEVFFGDYKKNVQRPEAYTI
jgi:hypothetical protein